MTTFEVTLPTEAPEWSIFMVNQLNKCFEGISEQMNVVDSNLSGKCNAFCAAVKSELKVRKIAFEARELAEANAMQLHFYVKTCLM